MTLLDSLGGFGLAVIAFVVVLGPVVLIHELGHFLALRAIGVTVLEFGLGFPPRALKLFERGGTIFSLNWLPIGGFVRPLGEDFVKQVGDEVIDQDRLAWEKRQDELEAQGKKRLKAKSVNEAAPMQRIVFLAAGVTFNLILAFVIMVFVALIGQPVFKSATVAVLGIAADSPATEAGVQVNDVIVSANDQPVTSSQDLVSLLKKPLTLKLGIKRGEKNLTLTLQPLLPGDPPIRSSAPGVMILEVAAGSPAADAFQIGDRIIKVGDQTINDTKALQDYVIQNAGTSISVTFLRNGKEQKVNIVPRTNPPAGEGALGVTISPMAYDPNFGLGLFDRDIVTEIQKLPIGDAIRDGWDQTLFFIDQTFGLPGRLLRGEVSLAQVNPSGPVGIAQASSFMLQQSVKTGEPYPILRLAAVISIGLAFVNILPIPGLDGGRILFVLIEMVRRKPISPEREGMVHMVGLMVLLVLMVVLVVKDVLHPLALK